LVPLSRILVPGVAIVEVSLKQYPKSVSNFLFSRFLIIGQARVACLTISKGTLCVSSNVCQRKLFALTFAEFRSVIVERPGRGNVGKQTVSMVARRLTNAEPVVSFQQSGQANRGQVCEHPSPVSIPSEEEDDPRMGGQWRKTPR
jgi:hypothetical protein